ncbi:MAG: gliding motility-associated C-terminal domain-containing protein, partial [Bacteroidota bacterium]|nr:gliding motility-associated C-terminal domain-containing protein [Bacteroidota bacterium]
SHQKKETKTYLLANAGDDKFVCGLETELKTQLSNKSAKGFWEYADNDKRLVKFSKHGESPFTIVEVKEEGIYNFRWTEELAGTSSTDNVLVEFVDLKDISAGTDRQVCGLEVELKASGISGNWIAMQNCKLEKPQNIYSSVTAYKYGVHQFVWIEKQQTCIMSDTVRIDFVEIPNAGIQISKQAFCFGDPVNLQTVYNEGLLYKWDFNGAIASCISAQHYALKWEQGGKHKVSLMVSNNYCQNIAEIVIDYPEKMQVSFMVSDPGKELPAMVYFTNTSTIGNISYSMFDDVGFKWNFGNGEISNQPNPDYLYTTEGSYTPVLEMIDKNGCKSTFSGHRMNIKNLVDKTGTVVITPNGDGENDIFTVDVSGFQTFTCIVLSRNGKRLHSWSNPEGSWNGYLKDGSLAAQGTYYYIVKAIDINGKPVEIPGVIYLFR